MSAVGVVERHRREDERNDECGEVPRAVELHVGVTSRDAFVDKGAAGVSK